MDKCDFILYKQFPTKFTLILLPTQLNSRTRLLSDVAGDLMPPPDSSLDFHAEIFSVLPIFIKYLYIG